MPEFAADAETYKWLMVTWDESLDWDEWNSKKLAKHNLTVQQIEGLFDGDFIFGGKLVEPKGAGWGEDRFLIFGEIAERRLVTVVWTKRDAKIRPITCRSMQDGEKKYYQQENE